MALDEFTSHFYKEYNEIIDQLNNLVLLKEFKGENEHENKLKLSNQYEKISNRTCILQKYFTDHTAFMPQYEIRKAQEHLTKLSRLSQEKRDEIFPKKKFGFKSKQNMATLQTAINTAIKLDQLKDELNSNKDENKILNFESSCNIKDLTNETVFKYEKEINGKDIGLVNIKNSTIKLFGNPSVLHAENLENCTILIGPISGSAFLNNLKNTKLIIACHQLRIHESHDCHFYIHVGSRAIIENCSNVKFAPYSWSYTGLEEHFLKSGLNYKESNWQLVDDFNWLNQTQKSPNWEYLAESERLKWSSNEKDE